MSKRHRRAMKAAATSKPRQGAISSPTSLPVLQGRGRLGMGNGFAYEAADAFGMEMAEWQPQLYSPDTEINFDRDRLVARSRDLVRNDPWAAGGITRITDSAVGSQFRMVAKPDYRALAVATGIKAFDAAWADEYGRVLEAEWRMWAEDPARHCDAMRGMSMTQMLRLALRHKLVDGEALAMLLHAPENVGPGAARYATTVQLIDPDRLSNPFQMVDTFTMRGGVQLDNAGLKPIGYHIRRRHQNDWYSSVESMTWDLFPKETAWGRPIVVHDFDRDRAGQSRGLGVFSAVLARMRMLARYDRAELQQALLQTIFATFVESDYDAEDVQDSLTGGEGTEYQRMRTEWHEENPLMVGGVRVPVLPPGETMKQVSATRPNSGFRDFQNTFLRSAAAATGQSAEQMSWDYSQVNYSSARAAMLEAWKTLTRRKEDFASGFANPIQGAFVEEVFSSGILPLPSRIPDPETAAGLMHYLEMRAAYTRCTWIGPARGWVDPVAERQGAVLGLDACFNTLERECAEQGLDSEEVLDQRAVELQMMKDRGIPLPEWAAQAPAAKAAEPPTKPSDA